MKKMCVVRRWTPLVLTRRTRSQGYHRMLVAHWISDISTKPWFTR